MCEVSSFPCGCGVFLLLNEKHLSCAQTKTTPKAGFTLERGLTAARRQRSFCLVSAGVFYSAFHTDRVASPVQNPPPQPMLVCYFAIHFNGTPPRRCRPNSARVLFSKSSAGRRRLPRRYRPTTAGRCARTDWFPCIFASAGENRSRPVPLRRVDVKRP